MHGDFAHVKRSSENCRPPFAAHNIAKFGSPYPLFFEQASYRRGLELSKRRASASNQAWKAAASGLSTADPFQARK